MNEVYYCYLITSNKEDFLLSRLVTEKCWLKSKSTLKRINSEHHTSSFITTLTLNFLQLDSGDRLGV
jgi:hypothetical protein